MTVLLRLSAHAHTHSGRDCINGTVLEESVIPQPYINFTTFWALYANSSRPLDPRQRFLPPQSALTIYNASRLYINLEGCVNTLRGECKDFLATHGRDGANQTAQSRFPCYYNHVSRESACTVNSVGSGRAPISRVFEPRASM